MSNNPLREVKTGAAAATDAEVLAGVQQRLTLVEGRARSLDEDVRNIAARVAKAEAAVAEVRDDVRHLLEEHDIAQKQAAKAKVPGRILSATWYSQNKYVRYGTRAVVVATAGAALYYGGRAGARRYKAWKASKAPAVEGGGDFAQ